MEQKAMKKETESLLRLVACLFGAICGAAAAMIGLLVMSIFADIGLPTAFVIQILAGAGSAVFLVWRTA
ncbi:hypothetical protein KYK30_20645 [Shinella yambaruensis]|uniref:Uncharacterized protein n=1 Tax=Shinella yambaruensis TaxID=415996 RepID=A0ABQ5ZK71_9HYPH|nr:hypothetical protein [Shinella yambaruensis]MCJ8026995.1 hypothetical protein [Shinella yambaruensis]MCU7982113.1 hypothetical protein [Shinella yambaruensis]GLR51288.1 hypothetical protein GCM10007923_24960 [Shinella yambaruensis]